MLMTDFVNLVTWDTCIPSGIVGNNVKLERFNWESLKFESIKLESIILYQFNFLNSIDLSNFIDYFQVNFKFFNSTFFSTTQNP